MSIKYSNDSSKQERLAKARALLEKADTATVDQTSSPIAEIARGRPVSSFSNETVKPWESEGISRNTWYVRRRIAREREAAAREATTKMAKPTAKTIAEDDPW